jgi:hypothetical protein
LHLDAVSPSALAH